MDPLPTDPYKGVRDFYPEDMAVQQYLFDTWSRVAESYGFERYDASILEPADLYRAKTGEEIVNEQTYTFRDRGDREVTLRPEMTPTVARMVAARRRELPFPVRWYSIPNLFRYERPQRGRLREHWQLNCDIFGTDSPLADSEMIELTHSILTAFGARQEDFIVYVNDRTILNEYFAAQSLSPEQAHQMYKLLDRKAKITTFDEEAAAIMGRPFSFDELLELSSERLTTCLTTLSTLGITNVSYNPAIVRGFDYYSSTVFEVFDTNPENTRSLFGGGRYDNLTALFGGDAIPAVGFGMGDVTMRDFLTTHDLLPQDLTTGPQVMLLLAEPAAAPTAQKLRHALRAKGYATAIDLSGRKLKDQIARAAKRHVPYVIAIGEEEVAAGIYTLRRLADGTDVRGTIDEVIEAL